MSESGLKQRKTVQTLNENKKVYSDDSENRNESDKEVDQEVDEDEYDADSKETRLTLMEEVLLLGLKDREVCVCVCEGISKMVSTIIISIS